MGVDTFSRYVTGYLVSQIMNLAVYILLFIVIFGALEIIAKCLDIVARLPILSGGNKLAEGLIFLWLAFLLITAFSTTEWGMNLNRMIESSSWLSFLYDNNLLAKFVMSLIAGIF